MLQVGSKDHKALLKFVDKSIPGRHGLGTCNRYVLINDTWFDKTYFLNLDSYYHDSAVSEIQKIKNFLKFESRFKVASKPLERWQVIIQTRDEITMQQIMSSCYGMMI